MATYLVIAPLALLKDEEGRTVYRYEGAVVELAAKAAKRFVDLGLIEQVDLDTLIAPPPGPDDPADDLPAVDLTKLKGDRPPQAASKEAWVDYAEANGIAKTEAEALSKNDIIGLFTAPQA